jgi:formate hydrogenlyase subunit 4
MRLGLLFALLSNLFFSWGIARHLSFLDVFVGGAVLVAKTLLIALGIALVEIRSAKLRLFRLPELLAGGFVLSVLAVITGLVTR